MTDTRTSIVRPAIEEAIAAMTTAHNSRDRQGAMPLAAWTRLAIACNKLTAALDYVKREEAT